jgi:hypothetical protein
MLKRTRLRTMLPTALAAAIAVCAAAPAVANAGGTNVYVHALPGIPPGGEIPDPLPEPPGDDIPEPPGGDIPEIPQVTITGGPGAFVATRSARFEFESEDANGFVCRLLGSAFEPCTSPHDVLVPGDDSYTFQVRARAGNRFSLPATRTWVVDTVGPETTIDSSDGPREGAQQESTTETFRFSANEPVGGFECRLDGGAYQPCSSPYTASGLGLGLHVLEVRAVDRAGLVDPVPARRSWTVVPADRDLDGYPAGVDCDDGNAQVHPNRRDLPDNGADEDCDGRDAVDLDRDRDGFERGEPGAKGPFDCDDTKPGIQPGAADIPGNDVDENCDGRDASYPSITSEVRYEALRKGNRTRIRRLSVIRPPDGATVTVVCRGKGCAFKRRSQAVAPGTSEMAFGSELRRAKLRRGAVLEVWITRSDMRGKLVRLRVGRRGKVTSVTLCVPPGSKTPTGCPAA